MALGHQQLGVEDGPSRCPTRGVVSQDQELGIENGALSHPPYHHAHPVPLVPIQTRLGPVGLLPHHEGMGRGTGKPQFLGKPPER